MNYEERQELRSRRVTIGIYLPMTLVEVIDRIASAEDVTSAKVIERLIRKGMAVERSERATAAPMTVAR